MAKLGGNLGGSIKSDNWAAIGNRQALSVKKKAAGVIDQKNFDSGCLLMPKFWLNLALKLGVN